VKQQRWARNRANDTVVRLVGSDNAEATAVNTGDRMHRRRCRAVAAASALALACAEHAKSPRSVDTSGTASARHAATHTNGVVPVVVGVATDSALLATASAYLDRHRYADWTPAASDDSAAAACDGHDNGASEGVEINALWGVARARVVRAQPDERDATNVNVAAEVVRVVSVEGDSATSDGNYAKADVVIARPMLDTLWLAFHRTSDGWVRCGFVWRFADDVMSPIALTGPPVDTRSPRGLPISRWVPSRVSWSRVRAMADSLSRP
jgi:hypothetical protein